MRFAICTGIFLLCLSFASVARAATESFPIGYSQDTGTYPSTYVFSGEVEHPVAFMIDYSGSPPQSFDTSYTISCVRGPARISDEKKATIAPPFSLMVPATLRNADSCSIDAYADASALYDTDADPIFGTIRIDLTGLRTIERPRPWRTCTPPARGFYSAVRAKWTTCRVARRVLTRGKCQNLPRCSRIRFGPWRCHVRGSIFKRTTRCRRGRALVVARASGD